MSIGSNVVMHFLIHYGTGKPNMRELTAGWRNGSKLIGYDIKTRYTYLTKQFVIFINLLINCIKEFKLNILVIVLIYVHEYGQL